MAKTGTLVALAWPDTLVVKEGKWYDRPMEWLGILQDGHYQVGHAALLLVDHTTGKVNYFDFGRYHTPLKTGRVRNEHTDPDLKVTTRAFLDKNSNIENMDSILTEVAQNPSTHGVGDMWASVYPGIDIASATDHAMHMQSAGAIAYGPFELKGTNCSRFVTQVALSVVNDLMLKLLLMFPYTISQTPRSVVRLLGLKSGHYFKVHEYDITKQPVIGTGSIAHQLALNIIQR